MLDLADHEQVAVEIASTVSPEVAERIVSVLSAEFESDAPSPN
ncbi:hypothetical protein [Halovenus carboxidivorans]